jgi:D-sedoheptulose 7-phosphate isomerase
MNKLNSIFYAYLDKIRSSLLHIDVIALEHLLQDIVNCQNNKTKIIIFGNGGSAANAIHIANDFMYGATRNSPHGIDICALPANQAVITCLANDIGYEKIFSHQIKAISRKGDIAIALSGSGNSPNIIEALKTCNEIGLTTYGIYGYDGGLALANTDYPFHIPVNDMQISEDLQLIIFHIIMQAMSGESHGN